ncbi:MAG: hypothetical protein WC723_01915 [Candidatus Omnitrophota bacterium]
MELLRIISIQDFSNYILPESGESSTFIFHNTKYYLVLPLEKNGDPHEKETRLKNTIATTSGDWLVSCWHSLENEDKNKDIQTFFELYTQNNDIAILSTVDDVKKIASQGSYFLEKGIFQEFKDAKISYYTDDDAPPEAAEMPNYCLESPFRKLKEFQGKKYFLDKEYRFGYRISSKVSLACVVFYVNPFEYIKKIYINPLRKDDEKRRLSDRILVRLLCWGMDSKILVENM